MTKNPEYYLPRRSVPYILELMQAYEFQLRIPKHRETKLGDYRCPHKDKGHRISVNGSLNKYAFLVTLLHEIAHLITWNTHKNKVAPHGPEWKEHYNNLLRFFIRKGIFPDDLQEVLQKHSLNIKASSCTDTNLYKKLRSYDPEYDHNLKMIDEISDNSEFVYKGKIFRRIQKLRKRIKCVEIRSGRKYLFQPVVEVEPGRDT